MVGTIFEGSHIPLNKWLMAFYLMVSSKKGISVILVLEKAPGGTIVIYFTSAF
jgi:hypothetical protein